MERAVAIKKLEKIMGKSFGYRVDLKAPDQDDRDEARTKLKTIAGPNREALEKKLNDRRRAILEGDVEYQQLKVEYAEAKKICDKLLSTTYHYRFTVGVNVGNLFFSIRAQGDTWEEVFAKLTAKQAA